MKSRKVFIIVSALVIWLVCCFIGRELSLRRPLWNDELYTHVNTISLSYRDLWAGKSVEGNNAPLFYVIQKAVCELTHYEFKGPWKGEWFLQDEQAQVALRSVSNVFMSGAIALMFYAIASFCSIRLGILSLGIMFALPAVWLYWVEARPYAIWIFLSVLQSVLLLKIIRDRSQDNRFEFGFLMTNIVLSLTIAFGALQACIASVVIWVVNKKRAGQSIVLALIPLLIGILYLGRSPKFKYWFSDGPLKLILDNVPAEYWVAMLVCFIAVVIAQIRNKSNPLEHWSQNAYLLFAMGINVMAFSLLGYLKMNAGDGSEGFALSSRYFLFLIPSSVIAVTVAVKYCYERIKEDPWLCLNLWVIVGGFLILRFAKTYISILQSGTFLHLIR